MDTTPLPLLAILAAVMILTCVVVLRRDWVKAQREERETQR